MSLSQQITMPASVKAAKASMIETVNEKGIAMNMDSIIAAIFTEPLVKHPSHTPMAMLGYDGAQDDTESIETVEATAPAITAVAPSKEDAATDAVIGMTEKLQLQQENKQSAIQANTTREERSYQSALAGLSPKPSLRRSPAVSNLCALKEYPAVPARVRVPRVYDGKTWKFI